MTSGPLYSDSNGYVRIAKFIILIVSYKWIYPYMVLHYVYLCTFICSMLYDFTVSHSKAASYYPAEAAVSSSSPNRCETLFSGIPHSGESVQYSKLHEMSEVSQLPGSDGGTPSSELYEEIKDIQRHDAKNGADGSLQDNPLYGKYLS